MLLTIGDISITGGAERVVVNLANLFAESGHSVEILSFYRSNKTLPYSLKNVKLSFYCDIGESDFSAKWTQNVLKKFYFKNLYKPLLSFHIKKRYKDIDFFIISDWVYTPIFRHKVAKYIKLIHLNFTRYHKRNNYFDMLVILSKKELETWQKYHKNIAVIPNFLTPFSPIDSQKSRQKIVLSIGRMDDNQKGFLRLIDIWAILAQDSSFKAEFSKWQLHIVGDGILKNELWKKIKAANLGDSIVLKPFTKNIQNEYAKSSIYALTSHYEGFGMVLLESGYFGLPSVAFDVKTGPSDIIENEKSGFLVSDNDLNAFADSLKMLMSDEKMRENFGKNAKQIVQEKFSKEAIRGLWENLLQQ
nr:glycosyltransferase family 4 protein [Helicobacter sp. 16-1353]